MKVKEKDLNLLFAQLAIKYYQNSIFGKFLEMIKNTSTIMKKN